MTYWLLWQNASSDRISIFAPKLTCCIDIPVAFSSYEVKEFLSCLRLSE